MYAQELSRSQTVLQGGDGFPQDVSDVADVQARVVSRRLDPVDFIWLEADNLPIRFYHDAIGGVLAGVEAAQHLENALLKHGLGRMHQLLARVIERFAQSFLVDWLQQVVESMYLESAHGVTVVCGHEDRQRQNGLLFQLFHHAKAVNFRHLDVEENEVRHLALDKGNRRLAIGALGHNVQVRLFLQQATQTFAGKRFIVAKQHSN